MVVVVVVAVPVEGRDVGGIITVGGVGDVFFCGLDVAVVRLYSASWCWCGVVLLVCCLCVLVCWCVCV